MPVEGLEHLRLLAKQLAFPLQEVLAVLQATQKLQCLQIFKRTTAAMQAMCS